VCGSTKISGNSRLPACVTPAKSKYRYCASCLAKTRTFHPGTTANCVREASSYSAADFTPCTTIAGPRGIRNSPTGVAGSDRPERTTNAAPHRSSNTQTVRSQFPVTEARLPDKRLLRPIKVRGSYIECGGSPALLSKRNVTQRNDPGSPRPRKSFIADGVCP
jgi:hypothetical protein